MKIFKTIIFFLLVCVVLSSSLWAKNRNVINDVKKAAQKYAAYGVKSRWYSQATYEAADFIEVLPGNKVLVGSVASGSKLGIPRHGPIFLYDGANGRQLWKTNRASLPDGEYNLLSTSPNILLAGVHRNCEVFAINVRTGKQIWSFRTAADSVLEVDGSRLFCLSRAKKTLQAIDLRSGRKLWIAQSLVTKVRKNRTLRLFVHNECVFVLGLGLECFALDGRIRWQVGHPSFIDDTAIVACGADLCLWSAKATLLVDGKIGQLRWINEKAKEGIKALYFAKGMLYRVLKGESGDFIEALAASSGKILWASQMNDKVVSPLVVHGNNLYFTGDRALYALKKDSGKSAFFSVLPDRFVKNSPSVAPLLGAPDMLVLRKKSIVIWRDRAGILACDLVKGKVLWSHFPLLPIPDYNVNDATGLLFQVRNIVPKNVGAGGVIPLHEPGPNPFLIAAEKRHAEVLADKRSDSLDVSISSGSVMNQTKISSAFNQAQAAVNMGVSMIAAAQAIRQMNKMRAQEGLRQRYAMQARAVMRKKPEAFQGKYFIEPFLARGVGAGVTLVDLDSGKRGDFLYSPLVAPLLDFSVDLLCFHLDERLNRLFLIAVGMEAKRYQAMRKWRWTLPRPALLAFDVSNIPFLKENRIAKAAPPHAPGKVLSQEEIQKIVNAALKAQGIKAPGTAKATPQTPQSPALKALYSGVQGNNVGAVKKALLQGAPVNGSGGEPPLTMALREKRYAVADVLLAKGADVNKTGAFDLAPIHFATLQFNLDLMKRLIAKKADVNVKNSQGMTPLLMIINNGYWFIHKEKVLPLAELLLKAGADTTLKTNLNISMTKHAAKQHRKLGQMFRRYGGR